MRNLTRLATRVFNTPLAIERAKLDVILSVLGPRFGLQASILPVPAAGFFDDAAGGSSVSFTNDGIAVLNVEGTLVRKSTGMDAFSGLTSYEQLQSDLVGVMNDGSVKGVLLCFDSPGGEVGGLFDLTDKIASLRGSKPVYASVSGMAASAAYALASTADRIFVTQTAITGSIGVVCLHCDQSVFDQKLGAKFEYIFAGAKKVDGNPHEPLSDRAREEFQFEVNRCYDMFVNCVAKNRRMSAQSVRDTEAGLYFGADAIKQGLADQEGTEEQALSALRGAMGKGTGNRSKRAAAATSGTSEPEFQALAPEATVEEVVEAGELCYLYGKPQLASEMMARMREGTITVEGVREALNVPASEYDSELAATD